MLKKYYQVGAKHKTLKPVFPALEKKTKKSNRCSENCYEQPNVVKCPLAWFGCQQITIFRQTSAGAVLEWQCQLVGCSVCPPLQWIYLKFGTDIKISRV